MAMAGVGRSRGRCADGSWDDAAWSAANRLFAEHVVED
jgi:hypothetical protein